MSWYKGANKGWQDGWEETFGDVQRYIYDAYTARVFITNLANEKITVSVSLVMIQTGHTMWQDFWRYDISEVALARATFKKVSDITGKIFDEFRYNDIPNPMLHSYLREALRHIDLKHKPKSRIPSVDWAREHDGVTDWRSSIYGNRYPKSDGF